MPRGEIIYSDKYTDETHEYRHVHLPKVWNMNFSMFKQRKNSQEIARLVPKNKLMTEREVIALGVTQSPGWIHYMLHEPEPHILLFRRPITSVKPQPA